MQLSPFANAIRLRRHSIYRNHYDLLAALRPDTRHPIFRRLADGGASTVALVVLTSTLISAIRLSEQGITDTQELWFLEDLADWMARPTS